MSDEEVEDVVVVEREEEVDALRWMEGILLEEALLEERRGKAG